MQGVIAEKRLSRSFLTSFLPLFPSLSLPFTVSLDHALQNSLHDLREGREKKKKKEEEEKWVRATYFFFPQFTEAEGGGVIVS